MSATEVKEIVYHCECRRFVMGAVETTCLCPECGRMQVPVTTFEGATAAAGF
ncbi:MAG: hypothetical protein A4E34_02257 [Methanoregula sp. PtaU1.Bin006]|uniref:hypothetical protein n=1 Tax=Methanoregula sp. PtaU1.Bin006 TaxID=1811681 RepID=UPI0009C51EB9|nr:hypothetical protein [Methanoregula sp. PtaU1.Bin006]OPY32880.1 MAG: hypothetical protein A4E34_02257 [Methanoregula sp. PtaU1.Bin006]